MNSVSRDFVTVDMRGLKAPLEMRARRERKSVSDLVRVAVAAHWGLATPVLCSEGGRPALDDENSSGTVKVSIRLTRVEAKALDKRVHQTGSSRGSLVAGLLAGVPLLTEEARPADHLAALISSTAEMATLSRDISQLCSLLRQGNGQAAAAYRSTLETLSQDARSHIALASEAFSALRPLRGHLRAEGRVQ